MKQTIQLIKYFSRRPTISLFLLAFIIRLAYFLLIAPWQPQVVQDVIIKKDAVGYQQLALNLKENAVFSTSKSSPYKPNLLRTPLYPALLAGIYGIFGENIWVVLYIQIFLGICTVLLAYAIGIQYFNHKTAFLSALLFSFDYTTVFYTLNLLTETLFTFLFMLTIYFLTRYFNHQPLAIYDPRSSNSGQFDPGLNSRMNALFSGLHFPLLLSGFFLALATLTRPVSVYFFLFLLPVFFMKFKKQRLKAALTFSLFTLTFLLALSPWLIRNYRVSGKITVSSQQEKALNWAFPRLHRSFQHPLRKGSWKFEDITHDLEHLGVGVVQLFTTIGSSGVPRMLGLTYRHTEYSDQQQGLIPLIIATLRKKPPLQLFIIFLITPILLGIYAATLYGIFLSWRKFGLAHIALLLTIIVYFVLTAAGFPNTERFRVPMMPYILLFAGYGVVSLYEKRHQKKNPVIVVNGKLAKPIPTPAKSDIP